MCHVRDVSCASFVCLRTLYHSCSSWSENSVFSRRSCSISGRSLLFCFPMSAGREAGAAFLSQQQLAVPHEPGPFSFFPCWFFFLHTCQSETRRVDVSDN